MREAPKHLKGGGFVALWYMRPDVDHLGRLVGGITLPGEEPVQVYLEQMSYISKPGGWRRAVSTLVMPIGRTLHAKALCGILSLGEACTQSDSANPFGYITHARNGTESRATKGREGLLT